MKFSKKALSIFLLAATLSSSFVMPGIHAMFGGKDETLTERAGVAKDSGRKVREVSELFDRVEKEKKFLRLLVIRMARPVQI